MRVEMGLGDRRHLAIIEVSFQNLNHCFRHCNCILGCHRSTARLNDLGAYLVSTKASAMAIVSYVRVRLSAGRTRRRMSRYRALAPNDRQRPPSTGRSLAGGGRRVVGAIDGHQAAVSGDGWPPVGGSSSGWLRPIDYPASEPLRSAPSRSQTALSPLLRLL